LLYTYYYYFYYYYSDLICYNNKYLTALKLFITRPTLLNQRTSINEYLETKTVFEAFALLGSYVGDGGGCLPMFWDNLSVPPVQE